MTAHSAEADESLPRPTALASAFLSRRSSIHRRNQNTWALFDRGGVLGHDGSTIGQKAILRMVPEAGVAVTALANADSAGPLLTKITDGLLEELTGLPPTPPLTPPADPTAPDPAALQRWAGVYERTAVRIEAMVRDGALVLQVHENDDLGAGLKDYEVELTPLPDGRFAGRWPYSPTWTPLRFLQLPDGSEVLHLSGEPR